MQHVILTRTDSNGSFSYVPAYLLDRGGSMPRSHRFVLVSDRGRATVAPDRTFALRLVAEWRSWVKEMGRSSVEAYRAAVAVVKTLGSTIDFGPSAGETCDHESVTTADGQGSYCRHCGETLA